jgi:hypothetical protein
LHIAFKGEQERRKKKTDTVKNVTKVNMQWNGHGADMKEEKDVTQGTSCDSTGKIIPRGNDKGSNLPCNIPTSTKAISTPGGGFFGVGEDEIHF